MHPTLVASASQSSSKQTCIVSAAVASATVANQPVFDGGGFPIRVREVLSGTLQPWEVFRDHVTIVSVPAASGDSHVTLSVSVEERDAAAVPSVADENVAGRAILEILRMLKEKGIEWRWDMHIIVRKGISLKGTGLGSSGASAAAALKAWERLCESVGMGVVLDTKEKMHILRVADAGVPDNSIPAYLGGWVVLDPADPSQMQQLTIHPQFGRFVIACPRGFGLKTADARKILPENPLIQQRQYLQWMNAAVVAGNTGIYAMLMEQAHAWFVTPRSRLYPGEGKVYERVRSAAKAAGALGVTISGAGPSVLAIVASDVAARSVGSAMHDAFVDAGFGAVSLLVDIDQTGAAVSSFSPHALS